MPEWHNPDTGEETYVGRGNTGVVSINLPKLAIESKANWDKFYDLLDKYAEMAFEIHIDNREKLKKVKASSNPLTWCEGGSWKKLKYDDELGDILDSFTASLGFIGVEEALQAMDVLDKDRQTYAIEITSYMNKLCEDKKKETGILFSLYSTPGESLCYKFQKDNKKQYGIIKGVTDREYMTNSWHWPVWKDISVPDKINYEKPFHNIATGGHISVAEFVNGVEHSVLEQCIKYAMSQPNMYFGVNIVSTTCNDCGEMGDFRDECPVCGSHTLTEVDRVCGLKK